MKLNLCAGLCVLLLATLAAGQNKISGSAQCTKPDVQQKIDVPDHPGHAISIAQIKCTWSKPFEVSGISTKDGVDTAVDDVHGATAHSHGYYVDNMANGDKAFIRWEGTGNMKDGSSQGRWSYTGGTGKFKAIKGGGTYTGKTAQDGSVSFDVEGEYTLGK
jgi:hypothetical protein